MRKKLRFRDKNFHCLCVCVCVITHVMPFFVLQKRDLICRCHFEQMGGRRNAPQGIVECWNVFRKVLNALLPHNNTSWHTHLGSALLDNIFSPLLSLQTAPARKKFSWTNAKSCLSFLSWRVRLLPELGICGFFKFLNNEKMLFYAFSIMWVWLGDHTFPFSHNIYLCIRDLILACNVEIWAGSLIF